MGSALASMPSLKCISAMFFLEMNFKKKRSLTDADESIVKTVQPFSVELGA